MESPVSFAACAVLLLRALAETQQLSGLAGQERFASSSQVLEDYEKVERENKADLSL